MTKIMDRVMDLEAVDWENVPLQTLNRWEEEALYHSKQCRCHMCALFFARMEPRDFRLVRACAIDPEVILALHKTLAQAGRI